MSIPKWRFVDSDSDGHLKQQCLNCYEYLYTSHTPGYHTEDGQYHARWNMCPFCGCKWEDGLTEYNYEEYFSARRKRINQAFETSGYWKGKKIVHPFWLFKYKITHLAHNWKVQNPKWDYSYERCVFGNPKETLEKFRKFKRYESGRHEGDTIEFEMVKDYVRFHNYPRRFNDDKFVQVASEDKYQEGLTH